MRGTLEWSWLAVAEEAGRYVLPMAVMNRSVIAM